MEEVTAFIEGFADKPLQIVLTLLIIGIFLYWFIQERPKKEAMYNKAIEQTMVVSTSYDKALENSTKAIENNTETVKILITHTQLTEQKMDVINDSLEKLEGEIKGVEEKIVERFPVKRW